MRPGRSGQEAGGEERSHHLRRGGRRPAALTDLEREIPTVRRGTQNMNGDLVHSSDQGENEGNREGKNPTKFGEESSIMADGLCFDSLCLLTWRNFADADEKLRLGPGLKQIFL